jgi:hypothetical protein
MHHFKNLTLFPCVEIVRYYCNNSGRTPKPSAPTLAHDVGMRSVCLVWVSPGHGRC